MPFFGNAQIGSVSGGKFVDVGGSYHDNDNSTRNIVQDSYNTTNASYQDSFNNKSTTNNAFCTSPFPFYL